jgi:hypothetical protein
MTYSCYIQDTLEIIKEILKTNETYRMGKKTMSIMKSEYNEVLFIEKGIDELIKNYNQDEEESVWKINAGEFYEIIKNYLFLIYYAIYYYINEYTKTDIEKNENYFKNFLTFNVRHTNVDLYKTIKNLFAMHFKKELKGKNAKDKSRIINKNVRLLSFEKSIIAKYIYRTNNNNCRLNISPHLIKKEYLGDPNISIESYFDMLDKNKDWFDNIHNQSTQYDLVDHKVIIENRYFAEEIAVVIKNITKKRFDVLTIGHLKAFMKKIGMKIT